MRSLGLVLAMAAGLSACAGHWERSYHRWDAMRDGPHAKWAECVDERSNAYLTGAASPTWYQGPANRAAPDQVMFTWVLADCAPYMRGEGWDNLQPEQYERLIGDAYQHFFGVGARIMAEQDAAIT